MKKRLLAFFLLSIGLTTLPESLEKEQTAGELHVALQEQRPESIEEKCATEPNEPILTPVGVINPFEKCIKGSSEMNSYVSTDDSMTTEELNLTEPSDESKSEEISAESIENKPIENSTDTFNADLPNSDDLDGFNNLSEEDMEAFFKLIQDSQNSEIEE